MRVRFFGFCVEVGVEFFGESKRKIKSRRQRRFDCVRAFSLKEETFFFSVRVEGKKASRSLGSCVSFEKRGTETARRRRRRNGKKTMAAKQAASMQRVFFFFFSIPRSERAPSCSICFRRRRLTHPEHITTHDSLYARGTGPGARGPPCTACAAPSPRTPASP